MADYNVNMKQWNGTSFDNVLPLAYNAKQLEGQSLAEVKQWVQDNNLLLYTGQYAGTGTYGESHPTSVEFPFEPVLFFMPTKDSDAANTIRCNYLTTRYKEFIISSGKSLNRGMIKKSANGKTITWYTIGETAIAQKNADGEIYYFAAIGGYDMGVATEWVITSSGTWTVPLTGRYILELYGGGGGTDTNGIRYQGGSSCQVYDSITLTKGDSVQVIVGKGGDRFDDSGSTSFGSYSVNGGGRGTSGAGGKGAGNKGADGEYANYDTKNISNGTFGSSYGFGKNASRADRYGMGGDGAVYLKYLGA